MRIIYNKKEIHLCNPSLEEMDQAITFKEVLYPQFHDFKIMIDGTDENGDTEGDLCLSK